MGALHFTQGRTFCSGVSVATKHPDSRTLWVKMAIKKAPHPPKRAGGEGRAASSEPNHWVNPFMRDTSSANHWMAVALDLSAEAGAPAVRANFFTVA